jgi:hypothetical protein
VRVKGDSNPLSPRERGKRVRRRRRAGGGEPRPYDVGARGRREGPPPRGEGAGGREVRPYGILSEDVF